MFLQRFVQCLPGRAGLDTDEESVDWNRISASLGYGITDRWEISLAVPYDAQAIRERATPYRGTLVRFCLGLEAVEDLIADAEQALSALAD